jgi:dihydrofolate reductase
LVTRQQDYEAKGVRVVHSIPDALALAEKLGVQQLNILGGAEIYAQTIDLADELILTEVHTICPGDAFFPPIDPAKWRERRREDHPADAENAFAYSFVWYERV